MSTKENLISRNFNADRYTLLKRIKYLEDRLFALGEMEKAPCFCCGYNGSGYYQPDQHACAIRHHKLRGNHDS